MVEGWPDSVPFISLSQASSTLPELDRLFWSWKSGATCWKTLMDEEFEKILQEHNDKLNLTRVRNERNPQPLIPACVATRSIRVQLLLKTVIRRMMLRKKTMMSMRLMASPLHPLVHPLLTPAMILTLLNSHHLIVLSWTVMLC
jgi:hypothetical protein